MNSTFQEETIGASAGPLFFDKNVVANFPRLVSKYPTAEFASLHRSTVPLLALVKDAWPTLDNILTNCGLLSPRLLHFEYRVPPRQGKGKASHTDLMVCCDQSALAVEAKWTEPAYDTVAQWLKKGKKTDTRHYLSQSSEPSNRSKVMAGWLEFLRLRTARELHLDDFIDIPYQMVHRAASVCSISNRPRLAYLLFDPLPNGTNAPVSYYRGKLQRLYSSLGRPQRLRLYLVKVTIAGAKTFVKLDNDPKGGCKSEAVQKALLNCRLFEFKGCDVERVR